MRSWVLFVSTGCLTIGLFSPRARAFELRCDDGVVEMEDSKYLITHKCGEPTYTETSQVSRIAESRQGVVQTFVTVEDWLYNFGPQRFVVVLTFENDKLIGMRSFGKGRARHDEPDFNKKVDIGDPSVRLLLLYGPPSHKEERVETWVMHHKSGVTLPRQRAVEIWTYNLGPHRFMRIYRLVDGRLVGKRRGEKGFEGLAGGA